MRFILFLLSFSIYADLSQNIDTHKEKYEKLAQTIWEYAEMGYLEEKSSKLLQETLLESDFVINDGIAGIPTAFVAEYSNGGPIIGILAEFDALPGLSQDATPFRQSLGGDAGHACGHHLFGAGSVQAAIAIRYWLERTNSAGTRRLYGTTAEEGGSGKVYIARDGYFDDVDVMLHWHPDDMNRSHYSSSNGNKSARFKFKGVSAHAAGAPQNGRSALDGVEAMNMMVNMMREHMDEEARIHYVITKGGLAPNVVPEEAEVYYYVRHPEVEGVKALFNRVVKTAEGAARGTETEMTFEVMHGNYPLMPNKALSTMIDEELNQLGGISYNDEETKFAQEIYKTLLNPDRVIGDQKEVLPLELSQTKGSTDVGDVSWNVPNINLGVTTAPVDTPWHSWAVVACGGMSIGHKGTIYAAKAMAMTMSDLFKSDKLIKEITSEYLERKGDEVYEAMIDGPAPINEN